MTQPEAAGAIPAPASGHVFLSYPRSSAAEAAAIRDILEAAGHVVWQDLTAIQGGDEWVDAIAEGINGAYAVVAVVSAQWPRSRWTRIEVLQAIRRGRPVIPVVVDGCDLPIELLDRNAVPVTVDGTRGRPHRGEVARLVQAVTKVVAAATGAVAGLPATTAAVHTAVTTQPTARRLEADYLDRLLLRYQVWVELYTPLSGVARSSSFGDQAPGQRQAPVLRVHPTWIDTSFVEAFGSEPAGTGENVEQRTYDDLLPAVTALRQLVLLGDPGSGKTTTLWYLLAQWAEQALADPAGPLPILVRLNQLGPEQSVQDAIRVQLGPLASHYPRLLAEGRVHLLLDGLNELPPAGRTEQVRQVRALVDGCVRRGHIAVVTCRELDYTGELDLQLRSRLKISPLDPPRIQRFVNAYFVATEMAERLFWQLAGEPAQRYWDDFRRQVGPRPELFWTAARLPDGTRWGVANATWDAWVSQRQHPRSLLALTSNPYLLFMVTLIFERASRIPQDRGLLFDEFVDHLLVARERLSPLAATELKRRLGALALGTMQTVGRGTAFDEATALAYLGDATSLYQARAANILSGSDDGLRFSHQLLQEYFAATVLVERLAGDPDAIESLLDPDRGGDATGWDETVVFLGGLYPPELGGLSRVVQALVEHHPDLACRVAVDSGQEDSITAEVKDGLVARCRALVRSAEPALRSRYQMATELGRLSVALPSDAEHLVMVCGGSFPYLPDHRGVPDFLMARTPVTNREFVRFVQAQGYADACLWGEAWPWACRNIVEPAPYYFNRWSHRELTHPDAPVVGICWYEAQAFCRWKAGQLDPALRRDGWCVRLPSESEWLIAVRGASGRAHPWGNSETALRTRCQFRGSGLPGPAPVGLYCAGTSDEGIEDLVGNVFELVQANTDAFSRRCRGGSWQDGPDMLDADAEEIIAVGERARADVGFRYVYAPELM